MASNIVHKIKNVGTSDGYPLMPVLCKKSLLSLQIADKCNVYPYFERLKFIDRILIRVCYLSSIFFGYQRN